jgi:hypothetical protein
MNEENKMEIRNFDPKKGQAFQGDVSIIPIPGDISISKGDEIKPVDNKLILQEGELTGHHHHIAIRQRNFRAATVHGDPVLNVRDTRLRRAFGGGKSKAETIPTARMYRDPLVASELQRRGILTRVDLVVGCLVVEGGEMLISHQEHDSIRVPAGNYLIGRQIESAGAEERVVAD